MIPPIRKPAPVLHGSEMTKREACCLWHCADMFHSVRALQHIGTISHGPPTLGEASGNFRGSADSLYQAFKHCGRDCNLFFKKSFHSSFLLWDGFLNTLTLVTFQFIHFEVRWWEMCWCWWVKAWKREKTSRSVTANQFCNVMLKGLQAVIKCNT